MEARQVLREFSKQFFGSGTGMLEGGDGTPIQLISLSHAAFSVPEHRASFGLPAEETNALLVTWIPAGMTYDHSGQWPKEAGVDPTKIPDRTTWVTYPKTFNDVPVCYKRGAAAFAG